MVGESGEIEGRAFLWRQGGRWVVAIEAPDWVRAEFQADAQKPKRGVVMQFPEGALLMVTSTPETQSAMAVASEQARTVQVLPQGVDQAGTLLLSETRAHQSPDGRAVTKPYEAAVAYVQSCLAEKRDPDFDRIRDLTGLVKDDDIRRLLIRIQSNRLDRALTAPDAVAVVEAQKAATPVLPSDQQQNRTRRSSGYRHSPETIARMKATRAAKRGAANSAQSGQEA